VVIFRQLLLGFEQLKIEPTEYVKEHKEEFLKKSENTSSSVFDERTFSKLTQVIARSNYYILFTSICLFTF